MHSQPKVKISRIAQLEVGDLFIYPHDCGSCLALSAIDPAMDNDKAMVLLGPVFPRGVVSPSLVTPAQATVISFGKEYCLRLPTQPGGWVATEPSHHQLCLAVTEQATYFRVNFAGQNMPEFHPCYVNIATGLIEASHDGMRYMAPRGIAAYAIAWEIVTTEEKPRIILACP